METTPNRNLDEEIAKSPQWLSPTILEQCRIVTAYAHAYRILWLKPNVQTSPTLRVRSRGVCKC